MALPEIFDEPLYEEDENGQFVHTDTMLDDEQIAKAFEGHEHEEPLTESEAEQFSATGDEPEDQGGRIGESVGDTIRRRLNSLFDLKKN